MRKIKVKMNKMSVYLGLPTLEINKTLLYEFWYDYIKQSYQNNENNARLCFTDTDSFIIHIKLKMFMKTLPMMLKKHLTHQTMKLKDHY